MSTQSDLGKLIAWYEANKPTVTKTHVNVTRETVIAFAGKPAPGNPIIYRGREIVCLKTTPPQGSTEQNLNA